MHNTLFVNAFKNDKIKKPVIVIYFNQFTGNCPYMTTMNNCEFSTDLHET